MFLKVFSFISMAFFTLFILWALGWMWFATTIALAKPNQPEMKTDAIVVLTGGNGRINEGLDLLNRKAAPKLFISGVNKDVRNEDIFRSWQNPTTPQPCCIFLGYAAIDTEGNAVETKAWVKEHDIKSIRLVTSTYHMPRAYQEISKILSGVTIIQHAISTDDFQPWQGRFWHLTFSEYNKMLVRWLRLNNHEQYKNTEEEHQGTLT